MLFWIIVIVVGFITFCLTPLGKSILEKMEEYNQRQEAQRIEEQWRTDMKRLDEEHGTDILGAFDRRKQLEREERQRKIELLSTIPSVMLAYHQYLEDVERVRHVKRAPRIKKVFSLEEFIEDNLSEILGCNWVTLDVDEFGLIYVDLNKYLKGVSIDTIKQLDWDLYDKIMDAYNEAKR